tara:strand:+ start:4574 stop:4789 length:216 start_codon:yes stop_codon:yes gene_type:complete
VDKVKKWRKQSNLRVKSILARSRKAEKEFMLKTSTLGIRTAKITKNLIGGKVGEARWEDEQLGQARFQLYF